MKIKKRGRPPRRMPFLDQTLFTASLEGDVMSASSSDAAYGQMALRSSASLAPALASC